MKTLYWFYNSNVECNCNDLASPFTNYQFRRFHVPALVFNIPVQISAAISHTFALRIADKTG